MQPEKVYRRRAKDLDSPLENNESHKQNSWIPGTPVISQERVFQRTGTGPGSLLENQELHKQTFWIPTIPPNIIPIRPAEKNHAANLEEKNCNEERTSSRLSLELSSTVEAVKEKEQSFSCLFDLNKIPDELRYFACAGDSSAALTHGQVTDEVPQDLDFLCFEKLNEVIDAWDPQLDKLPFTELLNSFNVATPQEAENSAPQRAVDSNLSLVTDSQIERDVKEPEIGPNPSLCTTENQQNTTNTVKNCVSQDGDPNVQEEVASRMGVGNLNSGNQKRRGPKPKPKRKKHRPKVVVDGNPKKPPPPKAPNTPKPTTPKRPSSKENQSSRKRKYERKSDKENSVPEDGINENLSKKINHGNETIIELPAKTCRQALNFSLENQSRDEKSDMTIATPYSEPQVINECMNVIKQSGECFSIICKKPRSSRRRSSIICKKRRSKRRRRLNTLFMPKLSLGPKKVTTKRKRSRRLPRTCTLPLLTATLICNQLPKMPFKRTAGGDKEDTEIKYEPEAVQAVGFTNDLERTNDLETNVAESMTENIPYLRTGELQSEYEDFSLTSNLTGSHEQRNGLQQILKGQRIGIEQVFLRERICSQVFEGQRIDSQQVFQAEGMLLQEVLQKQIIGLQEVLPVCSQEILHIDCVMRRNASVLSSGPQDFLQEERIGTAVQKIPLEHESFSFTPQSSGSEAIPQEVRSTPVTDGAIQPMKQGCNADGPSIGDGALVLHQRQRTSEKKPRKHRMKQGFNADGALVPYLPKPKKPSAKVDLDEESLRMWNQLVNIDDGNADEEKSDDEWLRREREVFVGRIDSFIARMHMIQGDRSFKPWKGSVVDSVVGVFLTQNVSDNLSSNAYMSLAAKFPLRLTSDHTASNDGNLEYIDSQESVGSNVASIGGRVYDPAGNMYYVTEPEPDRTSALTNIVQPLDSGIEGRYLEEIDDRNMVKDAIAAHTCDGSSTAQFIDDVHLSPAFNLKSDFVSKSATYSMEGSAASIMLTKLENLTLREDLHNSRGNMFSCEECRGDAYESKGDSKSIPLINSHDPFKISSSHYNSEETRSDMLQSHDVASISKETRKGKRPNLKETKPIKGTKSYTPRKKETESKPEDWEFMRKMYSSGEKRNSDHMDSVDWEAVRCAEISEIAGSIKDRGQQNIIAGRIKDFLNCLVQKNNCIDLEWLRKAPPNKVKKYLLEIPGLGLKSVECVRLLSLQHIAFPVDTNVGRIAVRLGWVPLRPLPEEVQIHLLEQYPLMDSIQKYLWPRLCHLDQRTLYELHYQMITFGKVFCTKRNPHCSACPLRGECKHYASAFASARLALPGPYEKRIVKSNIPYKFGVNPPTVNNTLSIRLLDSNPLSKSFNPTPISFPFSIPSLASGNQANTCEPIIEEPSSPEPQSKESTQSESNLEEFCIGDIEDIPVIRLQQSEFQENLQNFMETNGIILQDSRALVALTTEAASIPARKLKNVRRLRTEHLVYIIPDDHDLLKGFERRLPDDPCPYLLAIWSPGETPNSIEPPKNRCSSEGSNLCNDQTCYNCNRIREENADIVRGTILIPCLTANKGRFPLNGTYFQVNEVFADHETSKQPINVPRSMIANLKMETAYFGSTASNISKALDIQGIQNCFWRGFMCIRGFDRRTRAPKDLLERFHYLPSKRSGKKSSVDKR